ncbi:hypothetical protein FNYG_11377 [Fusarium nygamai]|uniref:MAGE domain-containing protein n=1 Tax=Gibberella nygamai TaxID=42673 RepID=A0A2K0VYY0_GIBNY|nr:hypothetical protein FNYG_11377 [Fusarium nygamai]
MPTQRRRRPAQDEESEEDVRPRQRNRADSEDENEQEASDVEMDGDQHHAQSADDQLVKKLVRYVISCEYSRTAIRRDGIKERGNNGNWDNRPKLIQEQSSGPKADHSGGFSTWRRHSSNGSGAWN